MSRILVYEGPLPTTDSAYAAEAVDILNRIATDNLAKQISSSWVLFPSQQNDQIDQQFAAQGQSFFQACGDEDAYYPGIADYEDSAYATLVGGTTLTHDQYGRRVVHGNRLERGRRYRHRVESAPMSRSLFGSKA